MKISVALWTAWIGAAAIGLLSACAGGGPPPHRPPTAIALSSPDATAPEGAGVVAPKPGWVFARAAVAAAHPLAAQAGLEMLAAGGSALDAAVAVQMVLTLVEPQSSGIGGGAFLLHWDGRRTRAWDGRETAPAAVDESLFLRPGGQALPFLEAVVGGRSVGVPGVVAMLAAAHRVDGVLPWARLFEPAIALAEGGFPVGERLHALLAADPALRRDPLARAFYYRVDGSPRPVGHLLRNPALAAVLRALATQGPAALQVGAIAQDVVRRVRGHPTNPGVLAESDLAGYQPVAREPLCAVWRAVYRLCGMPPPSSGHLTVMQILGQLEHLPARAQAWGAAPPSGGVPSADWLHVYAEVARRAYADRALYIADPAYVPAPGGDWARLLEDDYLRERAADIGPLSTPAVAAGTPRGARTGRAAPAPDQAEAGTSHLSIVDAQGRAVAMTTTIESAFGARLMSDGGTGLPGGFLLNNQLTDFSAVPTEAQGRPVANRVQPGKRPRSSMSPTLVFDARDGRLLMSLGSPGGAAIIHFTAKTLLGSLAWGLDPQRAIDLPNAGPLGSALLLEAGRFPASTVAALRARGHTVTETELTSGLQALLRSPSGWSGGADPRREGVVLGE